MRASKAALSTSRNDNLKSDEQERYGRQHRRQLLLKWAGYSRWRLSSKDVCSMAFTHQMSGGCGCADIMLDPDKKGENHTRHLRTALSLNDTKETVYFVQTWIWDDAEGDRKQTYIPVRLPHEVLALDFERRPHLYDIAAVDEADLFTADFLEHPVTKQFGRRNVHPTGFYSDKLKIGQSDSITRFSVGITYTRQRKTCWMMKSSLLCQCGCNGSCTTDPITIVMNQSLNLIQDKKYMKERFDGLPWFSNDNRRTTLSGQELEFRGAVVEMRADLPERCCRSGMKSHSAFRICMCCGATSKNLHRHYSECTLNTIPWDPQTHETYLADFKKSTIVVRITSDVDKKVLLDSLRYLDKYPWGRVIYSTQARRFNLAVKDRLIIGGSLLTDLGGLDTLAIPYTVYFLRPSRNTSIANYSLLWDLPGVHALGIKFFRIEYLLDCTLHTVDLGVGASVVGYSILWALRKNVFGIKGTAHSRLVRGMLMMKSKTKPFYKKLISCGSTGARCLG